MPLTVSWYEIALRLLLSVIAGGLIGLDRGEYGRPAGLRTTLLVCVAAAVAMVQTNLLLAARGKAADSFVTLDLMRLPLGILTGMGFIGGGAILRRGNLVMGVTTAATLWFVTIIGLCFGGGQIGLGVAAFALAMLVLTGLRRLDHIIKQEQHGTLLLTTEADNPKQEEIRAAVQKAGYKISLASVAYVNQSRQRQLEYRLQWRGMPDSLDSPSFLRDLARDSHVAAAQWRAT